jgi:hypothetical protein
VTSVHKGPRLLCLKNCGQNTGERNTPVGDTYTPGPDVWPNTALPLKRQAEMAKVEAVDNAEEGGEEEPHSAVEKETQDIHRALSELRERTREQSDVGQEDSLADLDKQHEESAASLLLAKKVYIYIYIYYIYIYILYIYIYYIIIYIYIIFIHIIYISYIMLHIYVYIYIYIT